MALINKKAVTERETASYKLDRATVELVRLYSEFIGSPQEHVVNEALRYIFRKDGDFKEWLERQDKSDLLAVDRSRQASEHGSDRNAGGGRSAAPAVNQSKP
jgi:hypothetical protein